MVMKEKRRTKTLRTTTDENTESAVVFSADALVSLPGFDRDSRMMFKLAFRATMVFALVVGNARNIKRSPTESQMSQMRLIASIMGNRVKA